MSPTIRVVVRSFLTGLYVFVATVQGFLVVASVTGSALLYSLCAGVIAGLLAGGVEYVTPVNPLVGKGKKIG